MKHDITKKTYCHRHSSNIKINWSKFVLIGSAYVLAKISVNRRWETQRIQTSGSSPDRHFVSSMGSLLSQCMGSLSSDLRSSSAFCVDFQSRYNDLTWLNAASRPFCISIWMYSWRNFVRIAAYIRSKWQLVYNILRVKYIVVTRVYNILRVKHIVVTGVSERIWPSSRSPLLTLAKRAATFVEAPDPI